MAEPIGQPSGTNLDINPKWAITLHPVIRRRSEVSVTSALSPVSVRGAPVPAHARGPPGWPVRGTVAGVARSIKCEPSGAGAAHQIAHPMQYAQPRSAG